MSAEWFTVDYYCCECYQDPWRFIVNYCCVLAGPLLSWLGRSLIFSVPMNCYWRRMATLRQGNSSHYTIQELSIDQEFMTFVFKIKIITKVCKKNWNSQWSHKRPPNRGLVLLTFVPTYIYVIIFYLPISWSYLHFVFVCVGRVIWVKRHETLLLQASQDDWLRL